MLPALFVLAQVDATDPAAELFKQLPCVDKEPDSKTLYFAGTDTPSGHADSDCYGFLAGPGGTAFCGLLDFGTGASRRALLARASPCLTCLNSRSPVNEPPCTELELSSSAGCCCSTRSNSEAGAFCGVL